MPNKLVITVTIHFKNLSLVMEIVKLIIVKASLYWRFSTTFIIIIILVIQQIIFVNGSVYIMHIIACQCTDFLQK